MRSINTDTHVHSTFSIDAENDIEEMCDSAIKNGIKYITFTEHVDFNPLDEGYDYLKVDKFLEKIDDLNLKYGDKLKVLSGVEFSEPHLYPEQMEQYNNYDFDLIIGAIHWIDGYFVGDEDLLKKYSKDEIFLRYYNLVYQTVKYGMFDVIAHFDFPKRYLDYEYKNYNLIPQIIRMMVDNNIIMEINSSSLRKGLDEAMPSKWILQQYVEMGGKKVTIGSDAHREYEVAEDFDIVNNVIQDLGLVQGYFQNRKFIENVK